MYLLKVRHARCGCQFRLSATQQTSEYLRDAVLFSCCSANLSTPFIQNNGSSGIELELNSYDYITRFMKSYSGVNINYKSENNHTLTVTG